MEARAWGLPCCSPEAAAQLSLPPPTKLGAATSHLQAGRPQEDHDLVDEAQQGHEHGIPAVEPLAEEEHEGDAGGSPAEQGQREGPAWAWREASELTGPHSPPSLCSCAVRHLGSCRTLSATGALPTPRPWRVRVVSRRVALHRVPEEKKMPAGLTPP